MEYSDYSNVILMENAVELPENTMINEHTIKLEKSKEPSFGYTYSLGLVELETLNTYIKINLANSFIRPYKFPADAPILLNQKLYRNLRFCINYQGLNNITIKNRYPLALIDKLLDQFGRAKKFTQLNFINAYYWMRICEDDE